jgi:hypothetical protein
VTLPCRTAAFVAAATIAAAGCSTSPSPTAPSSAAASVTSLAVTPSSAISSTPAGHRPHVVARTAMWHLPYPLAREAVIRHGSHVVLAGGLLSGDRSTGRVLLLDLRTGRIHVDHPLPVPVHDTGGAYLDHRLLVIGGGNAVEQGVVQVRAASGTGWTDAGRLPQPRSDLSVLRVGSRVVVLGGYDGRTTAVPSILTSADGIHWRRLGRLAVPVRYAAAVAMGSSIYAFGGERDGTMQRVVQKVGANGGTAVIARLPVALGHAVVVRVGHRILIIGGRRDATHVTDQMWWFDPSTQRFRPAGRLPHPLADSAVVAGRRSAYLIGGETPSETDHVVALRFGAS